MKRLELNQMEQIRGNDAWSCAGAGLGTIALAVGIATLTGPVGWLAFGGFMAGAFGTGFSLGDCVMDAME